MNYKTKHLLAACKKAAKVIGKNSTLPILDNLLFTEGYVSATDLEVSIQAPIESEGDFEPFTTYGKALIALLTKVKTDTVTIEVLDKKVKITAGTATFHLPMESPDDFPRIYSATDNVGTLTSSDLDHLKIAIGYVNNDGLRPAMSGVYMDAEKHNVVGTDAHTLYHKAIEGTLKQSFIIPVKAAKLISEYGLADIYSTTEKVFYCFGQDVRVTFRIIDAKYPDYAAVIPTDNPGYFEVDTAELLEKLDMAGLCANKTTHQVNIMVNSKISIASNDLDFETDYHDVLAGTSNGEIEVGVNSNFLANIARSIKSEGKDTVRVAFSTPTRALLINDDYLLMPVQLN